MTLGGGASYATPEILASHMEHMHPPGESAHEVLEVEVLGSSEGGRDAAGCSPAESCATSLTSSILLISHALGATGS